MADHAETFFTLPEILDHMKETVQQFHQLLRDEQQAIRTLSFGQFTDVTERKSRLLDELRSLEQERRRLSIAPAGSSSGLSPALEEKQQGLVKLIAAADRDNRLNATLIGESLAFLQGSLSLWQQSPASAALYSSSGCAVSDMAQSRGITG